MPVKEKTAGKTGIQDEPLFVSKEASPRVMDREEPQYPNKSELFVLFFLFRIFLLKPFNSSSGIQEFLFSGKKRMAVGADFYMDLLFRTLRLEGRSTSALDHRVKNLRVYIFLHLIPSKSLFYRFFKNFQLFVQTGASWLVVVKAIDRY
jgi:hypothetical protein